MTPSPIVFTSRTGGCAASAASAASRVAIVPRSPAGTPSPSRVKPDEVAEARSPTSCTSRRRPAAISSAATISLRRFSRLCSR